MAIDPIYQRITFVDANGKLTREAIRLLEQITTTGNTVQNISNTTVMQGQASAFDDIPQRDVAQEIINALLQTGDTPRTVDTDAAGNVDWSSPQAPADPLAGIVLADTPAPIQLDPLASAILNDTPQPVQIDPLCNLALFDTGCWDQAGAAAALLTSNNAWTGTNSYGNLTRVTGNGSFASGAGLNLAYLSSVAYIYGYDWSASTGKNISLNKFGGNVMVGTDTDSGDKLNVSGTVNATGLKISGTAGISGTITIPKLTTANGSITVSNGIITAFTNPT